MPTYRAVLFDFGGTLDGDGLHWQKRFLGAYSQAGHAIEPERFVEVYRHVERTLAREHDLSRCTFREMLEAQVGLQAEALGLDRGKDAPAVVDLCFEAASACLDRNRELLCELRGLGLGLGIVSNFPGNLEIVCREFGLTGLLDVLIDSTVEGVSKPDPRIFSLAAERLGVSPASSLVVGDAIERDVLPARVAGFRTALILEPGTESPVEPPADYVLRQMRDVLGIVAPTPGG
jgi:putative hydrolase of the HAD superfamily